MTCFPDPDVEFAPLLCSTAVELNKGGMCLCLKFGELRELVKRHACAVHLVVAGECAWNGGITGCTPPLDRRFVERTVWREGVIKKMG